MLQELKAERAAAGEEPEDTPSKSEPSETSRAHTEERGLFEAAGPTPPAFWLVPDNENAKRVTTEPKNQYCSSALQGGLSGLYLSFADETKQEITLGRSGTDIYLPDPQGSCEISKLHCSFVNRTNRGAILLVDRSTNANTEPYSSNKGGLIAWTLCGTEPFMAPEVILRKKQTEKVDIWSLFATIVWLRDIDNFRRNCSIMYVSKIQEWLVALSGRESLKDIKAMANLKPSQRPSAKDLLKSLSKIPTSLYDAAEDEKDGVASSSGLASNYNDGDDAKDRIYISITAVFPLNWTPV